MTHFAGRAGKVLFLSVLTAMLLAATALAADIATGAGCTTGSSLRDFLRPGAEGRSLPRNWL